MAGVEEGGEEDDDDDDDAVMLVFAATSRGRAVLRNMYRYAPVLDSAPRAPPTMDRDRPIARELFFRGSPAYGSTLPTQRIGVGVIIDVFFSNCFQPREKNNAAVIRKTKQRSKDLNPSTPVAHEEASCRWLRGVAAWGGE